MALRVATSILHLSSQPAASPNLDHHRSCQSCSVSIFTSIPPNQNQNQNHPRNVLGGTHHHPLRIGPTASPARGVSGVRAGGSIGLAVTVMTTTTTTTITTGPASLAHGTSRGTRRRSRDVSGSPRLTLTRSDGTRTHHGRLVTTPPRLTLLRRRTTTIPLSRVAAAVAGTPRHRLTGGRRRRRTRRHGIGFGCNGRCDGIGGGFRNEQLQIREGACFFSCRVVFFSGMRSNYIRFCGYR